MRVGRPRGAADRSRWSRSSSAARGAKLASRLGIVAAAGASAVLLLEIAVRVVLSFDRNYLDEALREPSPAGRRELFLFDFIRSHPDDRVVFELRPGVSGVLVGQPVAINSFGMRDVERNPAKPPGSLRIVGLGDSHAFGWGVAREETYLAVLERFLNERFPPRRIEVWNLAVPGYNTVQEVRSFELRADAVDPDVVVVNWVDNDMDLPNFLARRPDPWTLRRLHLTDVVRQRLAVLRNRAALPYDLVGLEPDPVTNRFQMSADRIPARYRGLAGWENMEAAFDHLLALARERRIRVVLLLNPDDYGPLLSGSRSDLVSPAVRALSGRLARLGVLVVDPQARIARHLRDSHLPADSVWIRSTDSHTNPLRHRLLAEVLLEELLGAGVIPTDPRAEGEGLS